MFLFIIIIIIIFFKVAAETVRHVEEEDGLIPLVPLSRLKVETSTMAIARSMGSAGSALAYLIKRLYSIEQISMSTLSSNSKHHYEQLSPEETDALKGKQALFH